MTKRLPSSLDCQRTERFGSSAPGIQALPVPRPERCIDDAPQRHRSPPGQELQKVSARLGVPLCVPESGRALSSTVHGVA